MAYNDDYVFQRDSEESKRLSAQHEYQRHLSGGHLVHRSVPIQSLYTVVDICTGIGIWLL